MSLLDRVGRLASRVGNVVQERVGDLVEDTFLSEGVKRGLQEAEQAIGRGALEDALAQLEEVEAIKPDLAKVKVLRGVAYLELGRVTRAIHFLEAALKQREAVEVYHFLALAYERQQRLGDARNALLAALRSDREPALEFELLLALGRVYTSMGRPDRASRELRRALKVRPGDEAALTLLAASLQKLDQRPEAAALLEEHLDQLQHPASWILLGQLLLKLGRHQDAEGHFAEALKRSPGSVDAVDGAAACAEGRGDEARLEEVLAAAAAQGLRSTRLLTIRGRLALRRGDLDAASARFGEVLDLAPGHVGALLGEGQLALRRGDFEAADRVFSRVVGARPDDEPALLGAARSRLGLKDRAGALRLLERVTGRAQGVEALSLRAELAATSQAPIEALVYYQEALTLAPEREDLQAAHDKLLWGLAPQLSWAGDAAKLRRNLEALREHARQESLLGAALVGLDVALEAFDAPLRVAIMGEFNAGKSTLINAILGEDVVPTGILPTTAHLNVVRYGPRRVARVLLKGGDAREVAYSAVRDEIEALGERIDRFEFLYPHPQLRMVHFIDTPGFNAAIEAHGETATEALTQADAILWLFDSNQALSDSQRAVLESVEGGAEKTIVLLNKVDNLDEHDEAEVLSYLKDHLEGRVHRILPLSALVALKARRAAQKREEAPDPAKLAEARWGAFSQAIEQDLIERTSQLKAAELWRHLMAIAEDVRSKASAAERRLKLLREQMEEGREALTRAKERYLTRELPEAVDRLGRQIDVALTSVSREVEDARRPVGGWLSPLTLDDEDLRFLLGLLDDRIDAALTRSQQQAEQSLTEPVEAAAQTLEWIARALEPSQARALFARLERFVAEERLMRRRLEAQVYERERANLAGRLGVVEALDPQAARRLGAEERAESDRKQWLSQLIGDVPARVGVHLGGWIVEYFDMALGLCDNVCRDIEQMQLELRYRVRAPFKIDPTTRPEAPVDTP